MELATQMRAHLWRFLGKEISLDDLRSELDRDYAKQRCAPEQDVERLYRQVERAMFAFERGCGADEFRGHLLGIAETFQVVWNPEAQLVESYSSSPAFTAMGEDPGLEVGAPQQFLVASGR